MTSNQAEGPRRVGRVFDPGLAFVDERLQRTAGYWREAARAAPAGLPDRTAFGIEALHAVGALPRAMLIDVIDGGARFRFRLIGTALTAIAERDVTGRFLDELYPPDVYAKFKASLDWVIRERRPVRAVDTFEFSGKEFIGYEALVAPLAMGGADVAVLLVVAIDFAPPH